MWIFLLAAYSFMLILFAIFTTYLLFNCDLSSFISLFNLSAVLVNSIIFSSKDRFFSVESKVFSSKPNGEDITTEAMSTSGDENRFF